MTIIKLAITTELYFCFAKNETMSVMIILLGASIIVALFFLIAFVWSVKDGQYDDEFSPAHKILFEEKEHQD